MLSLNPITEIIARKPLLLHDNINPLPLAHPVLLIIVPSGGKATVFVVGTTRTVDLCNRVSAMAASPRSLLIHVFYCVGFYAPSKGRVAVNFPILGLFMAFALDVARHGGYAA